MKKRLLIFTILMTMIFVVACAEEGDYYDGFITEEDDGAENGEAVPAGGKYVRKSTGKIYSEGQNMPETAENGDTYSYGDYVYTMNVEGWKVAFNDTIDRTRTSYEEMIETIAGYPIIDLSELYKGCTNMTVSPKIPSTVKSMNNTFYECSALVETPELPSTVENLQYTFYGCKSLTKAPVLPNGIKVIKYVLYECSSLSELPEIPASVTNIQYAFYGCTGITKSPKLPDNMLVMGHAFEGCVGLVEAPVIPETVTDVEAAFKNCTGLKTATAIPEKVKFFGETFYGCTSLTGTVVINTNTTYRGGCFGLVNFKAQGLEVTGSSKEIDKMMQTGIIE